MRTLLRSLLPCLALLGACASQQPPRNTVQHGAIAKEDLIGVDGKSVWYYLQTVVDVPYATGFTFTGEQSTLEKIRWDIQEKVLYARRAYEWVRGAEGTSSGEQGALPGKVIGAPVAAFAIEKHFDIIRDYNSATGEEINRIVENDTDRRWYDRRFVRVDWSKNLVPSFEFLVHFDDESVAPLKQVAVPYYVSDPNDPDAFRLRRPDPSAEDSRPTASYLEATNKLLVTPDQTTLSDESGTYKLPACYLAEDYGPEFASTDCSPQEIKVRHSFLRAGQRDYDPLVFDDRWMERFGYFSTERQSYDPQYRETETGRIRLANRWNLWQRSLAEQTCVIKDHYKAGPDPQLARDAARAAADAACAKAVGEGSQCASAIGRCTLPYEQREGIRKITYTLSVGFPADLVSTAQASVASWNDVFQTTAARLLHPKDDPLDAKLLASRKQELGTVFELKENDCNEAHVNEVVQADPSLAAAVQQATGAEGPPYTLAEGKLLTLACSALEQATASWPAAERFVWQRIGDLRSSMLYWVPVPTRGGLLGYGPSSVDPETGEIIQGSAFIYGAVHDTYAARATDVVGLLNCSDEACVQTYSRGVPVSDWVALAKSPGAQSRLHGDAEVAKMAGAMQLGWLKGLGKSLPQLQWRSLEGLRKSMRQRASALATSPLLGQNGASASSRLRAIAGTSLEDMARNQFLQALGRPAGSLATPGDLPGKTSLYDWAGPGMVEARRKARRQLAKRRVELASFYDNAILGLALRYKDAGAPRDKIYTDLRARLYQGAAEHEIGHTLGLRHNFAASFDAFNYQPAYWKLRALDPQGKALPRYKTGLSDRELKGDAGDPTAREGLGSYQYSSVMDYGAKFNADIGGLGYWDVAAIKFGYGQLVEVLDKVSASADDRYLLANVQTSMRWGEPQLFTLTCDGKSYRSVHYTEYPRLVGGVANLTRANRVDVPLRKMTTRKLSALAPGCAIYGEDALWDSDVPVDDRGRFEAPYRFCSDEYEGATPGCNAFDGGADMYEQTLLATDTYQSYYLFNNLKLDRLGFSFWGYLDTLQTRYFDLLRSSMQFYLLQRAELAGDPRNGKFLGDTELEAFFKADDGYGPWTVAVDRSINFFLGILATPEPGQYWLDDLDSYGMIPYVDVATGQELPPDLELALPTGKYGSSTWDFDSGYFWYDRLSHVGVFHDKYLALWTLTNADTYFLGRDTSADLRQYSINYYRLYPDLLTRYLQGTMTETWAATGHWAADKKLMARDYTIATPPAGAHPVDPQLGFSVKFFAGLLGVSQIPRTFDTSFLDSCRIWVKGSVEEITPSQTPVCFADLFGKKSFCAMTLKDAAGVQTGVGAGMIEKANELKAAYTADPTDENKLAVLQYIDSLELMRSITRAYSHSPLE